MKVKRQRSSTFTSLLISKSYWFDKPRFVKRGKTATSCNSAFAWAPPNSFQHLSSGLLTHHPDGGHGDEEASEINLPSNRVPGRASGPSQIRVEDGVDFGKVSMKNNRPLLILGLKEFYRCRGRTRGCPRRRGESHPRPLLWAWPVAALACGWPLGLPFVFHLHFDVKLIPVIFQTIPRTFPKDYFLKYKTTEK